MRILLLLALAFSAAAQTVTSTTVPVNTNMVTQGKGTTFFNVNLQYRKLANIAALQALSTTLIPHGSGVDVLGYSTPGDGGGGLFTYTTNTSLFVDGGYVHAAVGGGRWSRDLSLPTNPLWFGIKGDYNEGTGAGTDNTALFVNMINSPYVLGSTNPVFGVHHAIHVPRGKYKLDQLVLYSTNNASGPTQARGSVTFKGENMMSTVFFFNSTTNNGITVGNERVFLSDFSISSTSTRSSAAASLTTTNGNGLFLTDLHDQLGVNFNVERVLIISQPGNGLWLGGDIEQNIIRNVECAANKGWGFYLEPYNGSTFGGYQSLFLACRASLNQQGGWYLRNTGDSTLISCESIANLGMEAVYGENIYNVIFDNFDIEQASSIPTIKMAAQTNIVFGFTNVYFPSGGLLAAGFNNTNTFLVITNSLVNDGIWPIHSVSDTNINVIPRYAFFSNFGADTSAIGLQCSREALGMFLLNGQLSKVRGALLSSLAMGIVVAAHQDVEISYPRMRNFRSTSTDMPFGIWLPQSPAFNSGYTVQLPLIAPERVNKLIGGVSLGSSSNIITSGNTFLYPIQVGTTNSRTSLIVNGGSGFFRNMALKMSGQDDIGIGNYGDGGYWVVNETDGRIIHTWQSNTSANTLEGGFPTTNAIPFNIRGSAGRGTNIAGGTLALAGGVSTGTGSPGQITVNLASNLGASSGTVANGTGVRATFSHPEPPAIGDTVLSVGIWDGSGWLTTVRRVVVGTNDSAGTGFRVLRVAN